MALIRDASSAYTFRGRTFFLLTNGEPHRRVNVRSSGRWVDLNTISRDDVPDRWRSLWAEMNRVADIEEDDDEDDILPIKKGTGQMTIEDMITRIEDEIEVRQTKLDFMRAMGADDDYEHGTVLAFEGREDAGLGSSQRPQVAVKVGDDSWNLSSTTDRFTFAMMVERAISMGAFEVHQVTAWERIVPPDTDDHDANVEKMEDIIAG